MLDGPAPGGDDATEAAGWPFFGQFVAHDITADRSPIAGGVATEALRNARAPKLNLEILYSDGPVGSPYLFDLADPAKFLLGHRTAGDVPRNQQGVALIGDPRNDVHLFSLTPARRTAARAQPHRRPAARRTACPRTTSSTVRGQRSPGTTSGSSCTTSCPGWSGRAWSSEVLTEGGRWFAPEPREAYIPLEFADAAYRYGHGQIRHTYRLVAGGPAVPLFPDLVGFGPLPADRRLDLTQIFDVPGHPPAQRAKRLDGRLAASLIGLPEQVTGAVDDRGLPIAGGPRPAARRDHRAAQRRGGRRSCIGVRAADRRRAGPDVAARHPAVVLHPQGGRTPGRTATGSARSAAGSWPRS